MIWNGLTIPDNPYFYDQDVVIYHADCRDILPHLPKVDTLITDPIWPNALPRWRHIDPMMLMQEMCEALNDTDRLVVQLGCDSGPRFLQVVPQRWPFLRVCWLDYACPSYKGRLLYTGDVAYAFGNPPASIPGRHVLPGKYTSRKSDELFERHNGRNKGGRRSTARETDDIPHPAPRRLQHVQWLVWVFSDSLILDPFAGSGTTGRAAKDLGRKAILVEIEEKYCRIAAKRMAQSVMRLEA